MSRIAWLALMPLVACAPQNDAKAPAKAVEVPEVEVAPSEAPNAKAEELPIDAQEVDDGPDDAACAEDGDDAQPIGMTGPGGLGLSGVGEGGGGGEPMGIGSIGAGRGYGRGSGRLRGAPSRPKIVPHTPPGDLAKIPKEVVANVVRGRMSDVRRCYEAALARKPDLAGRLTVEFLIDAQGKVSSAKLASSDLGDSETEKCILGVFERLVFPKPKGGGVVMVRYPVILSPADDSAP